MRRSACALTAALAAVSTALALPGPAVATAATAAGAAAGPYVVEAESMTTTGFTPETVRHTWNGTVVDDVTYGRGAAGGVSTARTTFSGTAGTYDLITRYNGMTENGVTYKLAVNGTAVDSWGTSRRYGRDYTDPVNIDTRTSNKVALKPGDVIELTATSTGEAPRVDRITIQEHVGAPTSTLAIRSPNAALNSGFTWGKNRALAMTFYPGNPMMGHEAEWWRLKNASHPDVEPGYWGAYTNRESYYNRDIAHQSDGAHAVGLDAQTFHMMKTFAGDADDPGQNGWPLWAHSSYGAMYYIDGTGFRELPSPFNLMTKAYKQYQWTGDQAWLNDPDLTKFYDSTMGSFLAGHEVKWNDADPAAEQPVSRKQPGEYTATFFEFPNENLVSAADSLGYQYQSMLAYAEILKAKGDSAGSATWTRRAQRVRDHFEANWWDAANNRYVRGKDAAGTGYSSWGHEASFLMMLTGLGDHGPRTERYLDFIAANDDDLNVEATSYLPEMYYQYNRSAEGWSWLKKLMADRNQYPEISFLAVSSTIDGLMGVQPDAPRDNVATVSRLTSETPWVEIDHLKVGDNDLKLQHTGTTASKLTNNAGGTVNWEAQFYGTHDTITVNGTPYAARTKSLYGKTVSYVTVPVVAGAAVTATAGTPAPDTIAPSAPTALTASNPTSTGADLSWTASDDDTGVTGYKVYAGNTLVGTTTGATTRFTVTGLSPWTSYTFTVKAVDAAGNLSAASNAVTTSTGGDGQVVDLSALTWTSARSDFGTVTKDRSVEGNALRLNGTTYAKGVGTHANSTVTYALNGGYSRFQSAVGVDDEVSSHATVRFEVWGDGTKLYESPGAMTPTSATAAVDLDVTGVTTLTLKVTDAGDGINSDHADWAGARLVTRTATRTALSDLNWTGTPAIDWGTVRKDRSVDNNALRLNGTTYAKGVGTHANSTVTYALNRGYTRFQSDLGVDDEVSANATVRFEVWGDGVKLYGSPSTMTPTSATVPIDLDVTGVTTLTLKVTDAGDGINSDHADWAGATLVS
ncbi:NPCBM/NEW2 domain-containing protein [Streptomyces sp. NPDC056144]|uniref:NPCBM/NEW2 domain-containing protein n=1 Tax=unclassified Streptomyces TaxID=2593676 RepID=UPI0035DB2F31